jgi:hypothetical protein
MIFVSIGIIMMVRFAVKNPRATKSIFDFFKK